MIDYIKKLLGKKGTEAVQYFHLRNAEKDGQIYLVKLPDRKCYKIGRSKDYFGSRHMWLERDYGVVLPMIIWDAPGVKRCEETALDMTKDYSFEGRETRRMSKYQVKRFVNEFSAYIKDLDIPGADFESETKPIKILWTWDTSQDKIDALISEEEKHYEVIHIDISGDEALQGDIVSGPKEMTIRGFSDEDLESFARALLVDSVGYSKRSITSRLGFSQRKYMAIHEEMKDQGYAQVTKANRTVLTESGEKFLATLLEGSEGESCANQSSKPL